MDQLSELTNQEHHEPDGFYTGSWERAGRSPAVASIIVLLGIGALYFNAQTILTLPVMIISDSFSLDSGGDISFLERISETMRQISLPIQIILIVSQFAFFLIPTVYLVKRLHTVRVKEYIRFGAFPLFDSILASLITLAMIPTTTYIANLMIKLFRIPDWFANMGVELFTAESLPEFFWLVLVIAITPAICEEVLFRGYAQRTLERTSGRKSIWIIGVLFGLFHMQPLGLISLSIMGVVFGFFYHRSKSLYPPMVAHFTNNFFVVWLLYSGITIGGVDLASVDEVPVLWVLTSIVSSTLLLCLYYIVTKQKEAVIT